jgi:ABC-type sugar transport system substrate-binding protein
MKAKPLESLQSFSDRYLMPNIVASLLSVGLAPAMFTLHRFWLAIIFSSLAIILVFPLTSGIREIQRLRKVKFVAVSSSFTRGVTYYDLLLEHIIRFANKTNATALGPNYVIFSWFGESAEFDDHHKALNDIPYKGAFIVPAPEMNLADELRSFPKNRVKVVVDVLPVEQSLDAHGFIGGDEVLGGQLVFTAVMNHLRRMGFQATGSLSDPAILVLVGHNFDVMDSQRHKIVRKELESSRDFGRISVEESKPLKYQRHLARKYVYEYVKLGGKPIPDVIVATNDDMALGAREALRQIEEEAIVSIATRAGVEPVIVGYDGIPEVLDIMNTRDERFLIATVDVHIEDQARHAWNAMKTHLSHRNTRRSQLVTPMVKVAPDLVERGHLRGGDFESESLRLN